MSAGGPRSDGSCSDDCIDADTALTWFRLARVVAWLEAGAGEALDRGEAAAVRRGGSGARFARGEGVPRETRQRLEHPVAPGVLAGAAKPDALVTELDPDAPTR